MTPEQVELEMKKAKAISAIASQIIKGNALTFSVMKAVGGGIITQKLPDTFGIKELQAGGEG